MLINLDETSIRLFYAPKRGVIVRSQSQEGVGPSRNSSTQARRGAFTHVALICNDTSLQPLLPQIILGNSHTVTQKALNGWAPLKACNAHLWMGKSAWINKQIFKQIIAKIGAFRKEHAQDRQLILLMDAHMVHCSQEAAAAARLHDIWLCIIPASMTAELQPLDSHVFARFKTFLRQCMHNMMERGANEDLKAQQVLHALMQAMKGVLQANAWASAFHQNGFGSVFQPRSSLLRAFEMHDIPEIPEDIPSLDQFGLCFPKRRQFPIAAFLPRMAPQLDSEPPQPLGGRVLPGTFARQCAQSWSERLRPRRGGRVVQGAAAHAEGASSSSGGAPIPCAPSSGSVRTIATSTTGVAMPSAKRMRSTRSFDFEQEVG